MARLSAHPGAPVLAAVAAHRVVVGNRLAAFFTASPSSRWAVALTGRSRFCDVQPVRHAAGLSPARRLALRCVYFVYPLLGLLVVADTVVRVALLLFSRQENQKEWTKVLASTYRDHIIVRPRRVGYRIVERLIGWHLDVVVIEKDTSSPFIQRVQGLTVPLLLLDARQEESLIVAGIEHAHTLIIATNDDLGNVEIALDGRRLNPEVRVVLRMFDDTIASKLADAFKLDVAFSSAAVAAPLVAASVLDLEIVGSFALEGRELFTAKVHVPAASPLVGQTLIRSPPSIS